MFRGIRTVKCHVTIKHETFWAISYTLNTATITIDLIVLAISSFSISLKQSLLYLDSEYLDKIILWSMGTAGWFAIYVDNLVLSYRACKYKAESLLVNMGITGSYPSEVLLYNILKTVFLV